MQAFQERVIDEKAQLDDRLDKLSAFLKRASSQQVPGPERARLLLQENVMQQYSRILAERIAAFMTSDAEVLNG
jgi:hypothetical protein